MFTGLIEAMAEIIENNRSRLRIKRPKSFADIRVGSSICVSGVCLTIMNLTGSAMTFDLSKETLKRTTLGSLKKGDKVNLERAMKAGDRLDGHVVQGHVEGVGTVIGYSFFVFRSKIKTKNEKRRTKNVMLTVRIPRKLARHVIAKGSIALDGVSLTVADLKGNQCTVALIPLTLKRTTLGSLNKGDHVNIETDILARYAHRES